MNGPYDYDYEDEDYESEYEETAIDNGYDPEEDLSNDVDPEDFDV